MALLDLRGLWWAEICLYLPSTAYRLLQNMHNWFFCLVFPQTYRVNTSLENALGFGDFMS